MSPRQRVTLAVVAAALAAAGVTVGVTVLTSTGEPRASAPAVRSRAGAPPLALDLGVRTDPEARALRRGAVLYDRGKRRQAARIFSGFHSLEARIALALADWPQGFTRLRQIARANPRSAAAELHLGLALFWRGQTQEARREWRRAKTAEPDTVYAVRAGDLLHPDDPVPGLPVFVPSFPSPTELDTLSPPAQLAFLERRARAGGARAKLLYGLALQRLGRPISAEREFSAAAALAPRDPEAQTAAAVGLFDKDRPARAFARLGPLAERFSHAATVRFHLGLMLLWLGQVREARRQLQLARKVEPASPLARQALRFLQRLPRRGRSS